MDKNRGITSKIILGAVLPVFTFFSVIGAGAFLRPQVAHAQMVTTDPTLLSWVMGQDIKGSIFDFLFDSLVGVAQTSLMTLGQKLAYDSAVWLANGSPGKGSLFEGESFDDFLDNVTDQTMGNLLNDLAKNWFNLDLCAPGDLAASLAIQVGLRNQLRPGDQCTLDKIGAVWEKQWDDLNEKFSCEEDVEECMTELARTVFKPSNTELGIATQANVNLFGRTASGTAAAEAERKEGEGFKAVKTKVSGKVTTPAPLVKEDAKRLTGKHQEEQTTQIAAGSMGSGARGALISMLSIFTNTLVSEGGKRVFKGLFEPQQPKQSALANNQFNNPGSLPQGGYDVSPAFAKALNETVNVKDTGQFDMLAEFVSCPSEGGRLKRRPNECVISKDLETAIRQSEAGSPITIGEALGQGLLNGQWKLIPPSQAGINADVACRDTAFCYSNVAKLRQARILPLGFELAAQLSDGSWSLQEVVEGFNNCSGITIDGERKKVRTDSNPYCHLIDPNWILKAPPVRCAAEVPGPMLATEGGGIRHDICVDQPTCLNDDGSGKCNSPWGYCTKEKNTWRFSADSCEQQFASCTTFAGVSPDAQKSVSYLESTVDFGLCSESDVGCRQYLTAQLASANADGEYQWNEQSRGIFLNGKAQTCNQPGCSEFSREDGSSVYLKMAPGYLGCYDDNRDDLIQWPQTLNDVARITPREECNGYAGVCAVDEVGCTEYSPDNGDPAIPAIATAGDKCDESCVGYDTFKQEETTFEQDQFPLYFIPDTAEQCSVPGCDQFVNLSNEQLEYFSYVRQCERPTDDNNDVYYAWEGSDAEGYQLRSYVLKTTVANFDFDNADAGQIRPEYVNRFIRGKLDEYEGLCSEGLYTNRLADEDCRELFDREGNKWYRLLSKTISVSESCYDVRKTDPDLVVVTGGDNLINTQQACQNEGGLWNVPGESRGCQICVGGGQNRNGTCVYSVLAEETISCPAEENGCRAYTGNAGNNVQQLHLSTFDDLATEQWSAGVLSAESVSVGGKSLRVDWRVEGFDEKNDTILDVDVEKGKSYTVSFWAKKGSGEVDINVGNSDRTPNVVVNLLGVDAAPNESVSYKLRDDWQKYTMGPVVIRGLQEDAGGIRFALSGQGNAFLFSWFIDNVVVKETQESTNLLKNSWNTPLQCDSNPDDAIPGEALGCQAYRDHNGQPESLKSFTRLCRAEAVGCERLLNTHNTPEEEGKTYYARCSEENGDAVDEQSRACTPDLDIDGDGEVDDNQVCTLPLGQDYCLFDMPRALHSDDVHIADDGSTVVVREDSLAYLVNKSEHRCDEPQKGCMALGQVTGNLAAGTAAIETVNKLNNPGDYENILCRADVLGCEAYSISDLATKTKRTVYFRDPSANGSVICEYKKDVLYNGVKQSGWFKSEGVIEPCYVDPEVRINTVHGIVPQGDPRYQGQVAKCPAEQNSCTAIIDPADTSDSHPKGQPYYILDNGKLDKTSCAGQASLKEGCVLFDDQSIVGNQFDVSATYSLVDQNNGSLVAPVAYENKTNEYLDCLEEGLDCEIRQFTTPVIDSAYIPKGSYLLFDEEDICNVGFEKRKVRLTQIGGFGKAQENTVVQTEKTITAATFHGEGGNFGVDNNNNVDNGNDNNLVRQGDGYFCVPKEGANTILKVTRDRVCGEWLSCRSGMTVIDKATKEAKQVCNSVGLCNQFSNDPGVASSCTNWVTDSPDSGKLLTARNYSLRDVGWYDMEYAGFSLANKYPISDYHFVSHDQKGVVLAALPGDIEDSLNACQNIADGESCSVVSGAIDKSAACKTLVDGCFDGSNDCEGVQDCLDDVTGICASEICVKTIDGKDSQDRLQLQSCRGYPSTESPFVFGEDEVFWEQAEVGRADVSDETRNLTAEAGGFQSLNGFEKASLCQLGEECMCSYKKVSYGGAEFERYYDVNTIEAPSGLCRGGFTESGEEKSGWRCNSSKECRDDRFDETGTPVNVADDLQKRDQRDGDCVFKDSVSFHRGWIGYCLEEDLSIPTPGSGVGEYACMTWMPVDVPPGAESIDNNFDEAGYVVAEGETKSYCAQAVGNARDISGMCKLGDVEGYEVDDQNQMVWNCLDSYENGTYGYIAHDTSFYLWLTNAPGDIYKKLGSYDFNASFARNLHVDEVDFIQLEFEDEPRFSFLPREGGVRIVNDGKVRIYLTDNSRTHCENIAHMVGVINEVPAPSEDFNKFECNLNGESEIRRSLDNESPIGDYAAVVTYAYKENDGVTRFVALMAGGRLPPQNPDYQCDNGASARNSSECSAFRDMIRNPEQFEAGPVYTASREDESNLGWVSYSFLNNGQLSTRYNAGIVDPDTWGSTALAARSTIVKKELCKEVVRVASENGENAARTDRLWDPGSDLRSKKRDGNYRLRVSLNVPAYDADISTKEEPFGGLQERVNLDSPYITKARYNNNVVYGGSMLSCDGGRCHTDAHEDAQGNATRPGRWSSRTFEDARNVLQNLFGKVFSRYVLNGFEDGYGNELSCDNNNGACYDLRLNAQDTRAPQVAGVNCESGTCVMGNINTFSINGQDNGIVFGVGSVPAQVQFYGWADTDQMPIRNIIVDWDTGVIRGGDNRGKYRNHKPFCQSSETTPVRTCTNNVNVTCAANAQCSENNLGSCRSNDLKLAFGNTPSACVEDHFVFAGAYVFDETDPACNDQQGVYRVGDNSHPDVPDAELLARGLLVGDKYCVYQPKVVIQDNWGWCSGNDLNNLFKLHGDICTTRGSVAGVPFDGQVVVAEKKN